MYPDLYPKKCGSDHNPLYEIYQDKKPIWVLIGRTDPELETLFIMCVVFYLLGILIVPLF